MFTITIDGPSGSGKSTVADIVTTKFDVHHLNSGEFYRAIAYYMDKIGVSYENRDEVSKRLKNLDISIKYIDGVQHNFVNGEDVTQFLHTNHINSIVSKYATIDEVIDKTSQLTFDATKTERLVIDGRNVGSYVLPNAECKIYLDCDPKIRAQRRVLEMKQKGVEVSFDEILKQTYSRDELDRNRAKAPLVIPKDAIILTSDNKTPEQLADEIVAIAKKVQNSKK